MKNTKQNLIRQFMKKRKIMFIFLVTLSALVILNLFVFVMALHEYRSSWGEQEKWLEKQEWHPSEEKSKGSIILVHGYGGSPFDFAPLLPSLKKEGYHLVLPVTPEQTKKTWAYGRGKVRAEEYQAWLERIVAEETKVHGQKPILMGFSMGGALSTIIAAQGNIEKLVLLAPFYGLPHADSFLTKASHVLSFVLPLVPKISKAKINDPQGYDQYETGTYFVCLSSFHRLQELKSKATLKAKDISCPTLIVASSGDQVASYSATKRVADKIAQHKLVTLKKANHVVLYDYGHEKIIEEIVSFLEKE